MFVADLWLLQEALRSLLGLLCLLACAAGVLAWLRWQYLAALLVAASAPDGAPAARRSPLLHVLAWFVPVLCLWWPLQNAADLDREAWRRAHDPAGKARPATARDPGSALRVAWWSTWLAAGALTWPLSYASYYSAVLLTVLACVAASICAGCAVLLVRRITDGLTGATSPLPTQLLARWLPRSAPAPTGS